MTPARRSRSARRADLVSALWTTLLIAPALLFLLLNFAIPIVMMLARGVAEPELMSAMPRATLALRQWRGSGLPDDQLAGLVAEDMVRAQAAGTLKLVANRLNFASAGSRSLIFATADALAFDTGPVTLERLRTIDPRWGSLETWAAIRHASGPLTSFYLLAAADRRMDASGHVVTVSADRSVFVDVLLRTFKISAIVTFLCLLLGYPTASLLATLPESVGNSLMLLVMLPFWTSTLVRTTAWTVLLQTHGVVNQALQSIGVIHEPLTLVYNRTGVYIAMTHVLLPFMILPLYGVMKRIPPDAVRAARSLGAGSVTAFRKVFLPQSLPGIIAGVVVVFTLALGYYVTPALVGGGADQLISTYIAFYINQSLNWGMAAALSLLLLGSLAAVLFAAYLAIRPAAVLGR